jgi:hypothetical protein
MPEITTLSLKRLQSHSNKNYMVLAKKKDMKKNEREDTD